MRLPKQLFYVMVVGGRTLHGYEKGGGKDSNRQAAFNRVEELGRRGVKTRIFASQPLEWTDITDED